MRYHCAIEGTVAREFRPSVFFINQPHHIWALIHGLKPFCIWRNIRRKIENIRILAGSLTPLKPFWRGSLTMMKRFQRGHSQRWNDFIWPCWNFETSFRAHNLFKGKNPAKLFHREISPYHIFSLNKKSWGILNFIFGFSGVIDPA
jgi:hypothetical protein